MAGEYLRAAYPLTWPDRQPRTVHNRRKHAAFKTEFARARDELLRELRLLRAKDIVISSNVPLRRDGFPLADAREPEDPGVAVFFERRHVDNIGRDLGTTPFVIACDTYQKVKFNLRAIGLTVESLRAIERHASSSMLEQAFTGFAALPAHTEVDPPWWEVLGVMRIATPEVVKAAYRELARIHHPDAGGNGAAMAQINRAYASALTELAAVS